MFVNSKDGIGDKSRNFYFVFIAKESVIIEKCIFEWSNTFKISVCIYSSITVENLITKNISFPTKFFNRKILFLIDEFIYIIFVPEHIFPVWIFLLPRLHIFSIWTLSTNPYLMNNFWYCDIVFNLFLRITMNNSNPFCIPTIFTIE